MSATTVAAIMALAARLQWLLKCAGMSPAQREELEREEDTNG